MLNFLKKYKFLILAILIFILLSLVGISRGIWFDESYSMYLTKGDFGKIAEMTALDVHPPLYYWLLKIWSFIFSDSTFAFRTFSIFAGIAAIIGIYLLLKRWFSEKVANFTIFFLAINPFFLFYATETRMYTLVFALMAFSTLALEKALEKQTLKLWLLYLALITAGLYTHYFFAVVILIQFVFTLTRNFNWKNLLVYPASAILFLPWVPSLISQMTEVGNGFWIEPVTLETVLQFFSWSLIYFEYPLTSLPYLILIIITLVLAIIVAIKSRKNLKKLNLSNLGIFILYPPLILTIISAFYVPVYVPRYIIYSLALLPVFFAILAKSDLKSLISKALIILLIIDSGFGVYNIYYSSTYSTNAVVASIKRIDLVDKENTPIIVSDISPWYYDAVLNETEKHHVLVYHSESFWGSITPIKEYNLNYLEDFEEFKKENDSFWFITQGEEQEIKGFNAEYYSDEEVIRMTRYTKVEE